MTYNLAVELGPKKIRVNGIVPGSIEGTPGMDKLTPKEFKGKETKGLADIIPLQRLGSK